MADSKENNKIPFKMWVAIIIALILLFLGFYLYYYYPEIIPGMASIRPGQNLEGMKILVMGLDDLQSVKKGEIAADAVVLLAIDPDSNSLEITNIITQGFVLTEQGNLSEVKLNEYLEHIEDLTAVEIDYYFTISYQGFINLVDNLDGVEVEVQDELRIPDLDLNLEPGKNNLSGNEALNYVRWYDYSEDKKERIIRQQQIIEAMFKKVLTNISILDLPRLFNTTVATFKMVNTNLEYNLINDLVSYFSNNEEINIKYNTIEE